jgi:hypothetical protein
MSVDFTLPYREFDDSRWAAENPNLAAFDKLYFKNSEFTGE